MTHTCSGCGAFFLTLQELINHMTDKEACIGTNED
jgi:Fe-S cluster biogenesis protein NfuA